MTRDGDISPLEIFEVRGRSSVGRQYRRLYYTDVVYSFRYVRNVARGVTMRAKFRSQYIDISQNCHDGNTLQIVKDRHALRWR